MAEGYKNKGFNIPLQLHAFSDTIIITGSNTKLLKDRPVQFISYLASLVIPPFITAIKNKIFFRGSISISDFYQSKIMVIGPAVDEAAQYYITPNWIGVSTSPSASISINECSNSIKNVFIQYDIPHKTFIEKDGWALSWTREDTNHNCKTIMQNEMNMQHIGIEEEYFKYKNTLDFYEDQESSLM
jgi:hypothetical protein